MLDFRHIRSSKEIGANLAAIVDGIPEGFLQAGRIMNPAHRTVIFNPQQDHTAVGIGHGAVSFPQAFRHPAPGRLEFQLLVFSPVKTGENLNRINGVIFIHAVASRTSAIMMPHIWDFPCPFPILQDC